MAAEQRDACPRGPPAPEDLPPPPAALGARTARPAWRGVRVALGARGLRPPPGFGTPLPASGPPSSAPGPGPRQALPGALRTVGPRQPQDLSSGPLSARAEYFFHSPKDTSWRVCLRTCLSSTFSLWKVGGFTAPSRS